MDISGQLMAAAADQVAQLAIYVVVGGAVTLVSLAAKKYLGIKFTDAQWAAFSRAAENVAKQQWAAEDASIATRKIHVDSPWVANLATRALSAIPNIVHGLGLTPANAQAWMQHYIASHFGALQAQAQAVQIPTEPVIKDEKAGPNVRPVA